MGWSYDPGPAPRWSSSYVPRQRPGREVPIRVEGLAEFRKQLKTLGADMPKVLRLALKASGEPVAAAVRSKLPHRSGDAARTVRVTTSGSWVKLMEGTTKVSYLPWLEFGGSVGRGHTLMASERGRKGFTIGGRGQGSIKRPWLPRGRYLWIEFAKEAVRGDFNAALMKALTDAAAQAGLPLEVK